MSRPLHPSVLKLLSASLGVGRCPEGDPFEPLRVELMRAPPRTCVLILEDLLRVAVSIHEDSPELAVRFSAEAHALGRAVVARHGQVGAMSGALEARARRFRHFLGTSRPSDG